MNPYSKVRAQNFLNSLIIHIRSPSDFCYKRLRNFDRGASFIGLRQVAGIEAVAGIEIILDRLHSELPGLLSHLLKALHFGLSGDYFGPETGNITGDV